MYFTSLATSSYICTYVYVLVHICGHSCIHICILINMYMCLHMRFIFPIYILIFIYFSECSKNNECMLLIMYTLEVSISDSLLIPTFSNQVVK